MREEVRIGFGLLGRVIAEVIAGASSEEAEEPLRRILRLARGEKED